MTLSVREWIEQEQGKHFCICGCGKPIRIDRQHRSRGIPKIIKGHLGRMDNGGKLEIQKIIDENQGNVFCLCGCGQPFKITAKHVRDGVPPYKQGHHPLFNPHEGTERKVLKTEEDFWALVDKGNGCWRWKGRPIEGNRGTFCYRGERRLASRLSYFFYYGIEPGDLFVCHRCDNPICVRPDHLFLGTQADNMADAASKGRLGVKLDVEKVIKLVGMVKDGVVRREVAVMFGISKGTVDKIMYGYVWSHVTGIPRKQRTTAGV